MATRKKSPAKKTAKPLVATLTPAPSATVEFDTAVGENGVYVHSDGAQYRTLMDLIGGEPIKDVDLPALAKLHLAVEEYRRNG